jgi:hypothetical protein
MPAQLAAACAPHPQGIQVPTESAAFIAMHQEIRDRDIHTQLENGRMEHLWVIKGNIP